MAGEGDRRGWQARVAGEGGRRGWRARVAGKGGRQEWQARVAGEGGRSSLAEDSKVHLRRKKCPRPS